MMLNTPVGVGWLRGPLEPREGAIGCPTEQSVSCCSSSETIICSGPGTLEARSVAAGSGLAVCGARGARGTETRRAFEPPTSGVVATAACGCDCAQNACAGADRLLPRTMAVADVARIWLVYRT